MKAVSVLTISTEEFVFDEELFCSKKYGYTKHKEGWIKETKDGRFHIKQDGFKEYTIHFDVYIEQGSKKHMVLPSTDLLRKERNRIVGLLQKLPKLHYYKHLGLKVNSSDNIERRQLADVQAELVAIKKKAEQLSVTNHGLRKMNETLKQELEVLKGKNVIQWKNLPWQTRLLLNIKKILRNYGIKI